MSKSLNFPRIESMTLENFSLFSRKALITAEFPDGVFCLAGANGLGKSTFLLALNYGLTGVVPDPGRRFQSFEEYYLHTLEFSKKFFSGRIHERDREAAQVSLRLSVGNYRYSIVRGMFAPRELRSFELSAAKDNPKSFDQDFTDISGAERHEEYSRRLAQHIGLDSFEQWVFLQHFVFTFDERRDLLFWNEQCLERVLYIAFGVTPDEATRADLLRRDIDRAWSRARNSSWEVSKIRGRIKDLEKERESEHTEEDSDAIERHHRDLIRNRDSAQQALTRLSDELRDIELRIGELGADRAVARAGYEEAFSRYMRQRTTLANHPLIAFSARDHKCGLCGSEGEQVVVRILDRMHAEVCPLCGSTVRKESAGMKAKAFTRLEEIDRTLAEMKVQADEAFKAKARLSSEQSTAKQRLVGIEEDLKTFEHKNKELISKLQKEMKRGELDAILEGYYKRMEELTRSKEKAYGHRDKKRSELRDLQKGLESQYVLAAEEFVPRFRQLAKSFLGLELHIRLETKGGADPGITLLLDVSDTPRRHLHQLSESQRFFLDIALRMALAHYMCGPHGGATLCIDTPEGSLDIAYESRAGDMFAGFAEDGHHIIMTANINTSRLLRRLGERCGRSLMRLHRMTSWTDLSLVQIQEEHLFEQAYEEIERALAAG